MTCYLPLTLYKAKSGPSSKTGKVPLVSLAFGDVMKPVQVPCGRCIGCRLERSRQWAIRIMHENQLHMDSVFLTLTYRDNELIHGGNATGTLYPRHLTLFLKRLRKKYGSGIRFFACGEYGEKEHRPHYHAIIFGLDFQDKAISPNNSKSGFPVYESQTLNKIWGLGDCYIGAVSFESAAYVARYIVDKKLGEESDFYHEEGIHPEFVRMSRRPGIGADWYAQYKSDLYPHGYAVIRGGVKSNIPRFYEKKFEESNPLLLQKIKEKRKKIMDEKWDEYSPSKLRIKEHIKRAQLRSLKRSLNH